MRVLGGLVVALLFGCSGASPADVEQAPGELAHVFELSDEPAPAPRPRALSVCLYDVSDAARADVVAGVTTWATVLAPWRDVVVGESTDCNVMIYEVGAHANLCSSDDVAGCTRQIGGLEQDDPRTEIFLYRGNYEALATGATMHEIGHLLGLTHVEAGLMAPRMSPASEVTTPDAATLERLSGILGVEL